MAEEGVWLSDARSRSPARPQGAIGMGGSLLPMAAPDLGRLEGAVKATVRQLRRMGWLNFIRIRPKVHGEIEYAVRICDEKRGYAGMVTEGRIAGWRGAKMSVRVPRRSCAGRFVDCGVLTEDRRGPALCH